jgi:hypothetical protein
MVSLSSVADHCRTFGVTEYILDDVLDDPYEHELVGDNGLVIRMF